MAVSQAEKVLLSESGEFLVLSRLLRRGLVASQAPRTWKADDILVHTGQTIQVKTTNKGKRPTWLVGTHVDTSASRFFALVDFRDPVAPTVYVVPSRVLEEVASTADRRYYEQRPKSKPWGGRTVEDGWNHDVPEYPSGWLQPYREAWHLLQS